MRKEFKLSNNQLQRLFDASKPTPYIVVGGCAPRSPQEKTNMVWRDLGREMGFLWETAQPIDGRGMEWFSAEAAEGGNE